jgi:ABC-type multidrug transport system, ATPase and permease components
MRKKYNLLQNNIYVLQGVFKYNKLILLLIAANTFVTAIAPFIGILLPRQILNELLTTRCQERIVVLLAIFFILSSMTAYLTQYLRGVFMAQPIKVITPYMNAMYRKCMDISFQCTEDPDFLNSVRTATKGGGRNNFDGISGMLHKWFEVPGALIALFGYIAIVSKLNGWILLYLLFSIGVNYRLSLAQKKFEHSREKKLAGDERRSEYLYKIMYDFSYGKEIRLYGLTDWLGERFMHCRDKIRREKKDVKNFAMRNAWVEAALSLVREGIVYAYLIYMVTQHNMPVADLLMYMTTIAGFRGAFEKVAANFSELYGLSMQINDYRTFMSWPDEMEEAERPLPIPEGPYEFELRNVSYRYPGNGQYVFRKLNLTIPGGQKLAIVGHNGAGKTTFIKLLLRLYDVTEGEILCNGINIKRFDRIQYYRLFSAVFQEILPLAFSVTDNIGVNDAGRIDVERVQQCIQKVGLEEKMKSLKYNTDTCVQKIIDDEGIEFSGGEKQKLMIARALYKNGGVMVLDEPTAALDALAERDIYESFSSLAENRTTIYVSHRLASTRFCDRIAMFEKGRLVEYGTHEELLAQKGKYAEMFSIQAKYYRAEEQF